MKLLISCLILSLAGCAHTVEAHCLNGKTVQVRKLKSNNPYLKRTVMQSRIRLACRAL